MQGPPSTADDTEARTQAAFGVSSFLDRYGRDAKLCCELIGQLIQTLPEKLSELEEAIRQGEASRIKHVAHKLKGVSMAFSADTMTELLKQLEAGVAPTEYGRLLQQLRLEARNFVRAAGTWLETWAKGEP